MGSLCLLLAYYSSSTIGLLQSEIGGIVGYSMPFMPAYYSYHAHKAYQQYEAS